ncbi:unnamed protein product [Tilletia controversa]|uniref:Nudix hydrolase domain-containing protein n=1 Tax=Tilletia controversa TaxID=13291 RepID=A0A8X7MWT4_9BASI|nr:hypothetical protein CF328_g3701 [Tilletia controversa]KAE8203092.1 hypothetical protein CF335_g3168 [Tilletia laevis]KAE8252879.1 hypothetical protein A4X06_0g1872 [Tilletia controversa]CAD6942521.1 unnamed protein product [Tilletia controversa]CAD7068415.1 unnamed protein product [Tilletia caries]
MGGATGPPSIPPSLLLDPALPPYSTLAFPAHLQDLACRFIVNLPADELTSIERICFQVEQAHWFYEDFLRPLNPTLPSLNLRRFSTHLLSASAQIVPFIKQYVTSSGNNAGELEMNLEKAFDDFLKYKTRVPVCGVIMLDEKWEKCLLVKGWKSSAAWGFPKGKINHSESTRDCAVREVYEETGFDCGDLLPSDSKDFLELTMREQKIRLYVVPGVSENTHFETLTRKEISKIAWFLLRDLPAWKHNSADGGNGKFYSVAPFAGRLKAWISQNRKTHPRRPMVKQGAIDITEAAQAVEEDQDEAEAAQAEQTRHLLDRLFAPIQTVEEEKTSASDGILDPLTLPTGTALLDHLFGKSSSEVPSDAAEPGAPPAPVGPPANGQVLLDILFGKHEATQPPAPAAALATATTPSPAPLNGNGQVLLDMLLAPRRSSGAVPTPTNASNSNGPTSSAQALLNSLFAAASSGPSRHFAPPVFHPMFPPFYPHGPPPPMHLHQHQHQHPPPFMHMMQPPPTPPPPPPPQSFGYGGFPPQLSPGASIPLSFFLGNSAPLPNGNGWSVPPPPARSRPPHASPTPPPPPPPPSFPPAPPAPRRAPGPPPIPVPLPPAPLPPSPASSRPGPANAQGSLLLNILKPRVLSPVVSSAAMTTATASSPLPPLPPPFGAARPISGGGGGPNTSTTTPSISSSPAVPTKQLAPHQANLLSTLLGKRV